MSNPREIFIHPAFSFSRKKKKNRKYDRIPIREDGRRKKESFKKLNSVIEEGNVQTVYFSFFFYYYPPHLIYRESFVDEIIEESDPRPGK